MGENLVFIPHQILIFDVEFVFWWSSKAAAEQQRKFLVELCDFVSEAAVEQQEQGNSLEQHISPNFYLFLSADPNSS